MSDVNESSNESVHNSVENPTALLNLAQKLHDEYVEAGREKAEQIEAEAQARATSRINEAEKFHNTTIFNAETTSTQLIEESQMIAFSTVRDAEDKAHRIVTAAQAEQDRLELRIAELQKFENDYRSNLKELVNNANSTLNVDSDDYDSEICCEDESNDEALPFTEAEAIIEDDKSAEEDTLVVEEETVEIEVEIEVEVVDEVLDDAHSEMINEGSPSIDAEHSENENMKEEKGDNHEDVIEDDTSASYTDADHKEDK